VVVFCTRCGTQARDDDAFCARCGRPLVAPSAGDAPSAVAAAPALAVPAGAAVPSAAARERATFGRRLAAFTVDLLVLAGATLLLFFVAGVAVTIDIMREDGALPDAELQRRVERRFESPEVEAVTTAAAGVLFAGFWLLGHGLGVTPGKKALGVRVVRTDGRRPGPLWGTVRAFAALLGALPLLLGYLWALWDPEGRTWHDRLAGTHVVRG
jgi:uncharacterized RDD family membrane protein YckC